MAEVLDPAVQTESLALRRPAPDPSQPRLAARDLLLPGRSVSRLLSEVVFVAE